jgi:hypothetical protein
MTYAVGYYDDHGCDLDGTRRGPSDGGRRRQQAQTTTQEAKTIVTDSWVPSKTRVALIALVRTMVRRGRGPPNAPETAEARWP